jgi:peroxiredoxin
LPPELRADALPPPANGDTGERRDETRGLRRVIWAMTAILGVSLAVNLLLAYRIRQANQPRASVKTTPLPAGTTVPPIKAQSLDGGEVTISSKDGPQPLIIYVFTPQCSWCVRNLANLKTILAQRRDSYRFIALSLTDKDLKQYVAEEQIDIPVFINPVKEAREQYGLGSTPQTIIVSPDGKILQNWVGAYTGARQAEVEGYFGVSLPGLSDEN